MPTDQRANRDQAGKQGKPTQADWARIWFDKLAKFHQINDPQRWTFSDQDVIAFLRSKLEQGVPAWKRLKIVQALIYYRNHVRQSKSPRLEPIRAKLQEMVHREKNKQEGELTIEERVGRINPKEPDVIQAMRRTLRVQGKLHNTEKAYVKWAKRFMAARGLKNLADFEGIDSVDIEAFLTDLAVDGNVAGSTQEQVGCGRGQGEGCRGRAAGRDCEAQAGVLVEPSVVLELPRGVIWGAELVGKRHAEFSPPHHDLAYFRQRCLVRCGTLPACVALVGKASSVCLLKCQIMSGEGARPVAARAELFASAE